jgi:hypothetical protein
MKYPLPEKILCRITKENYPVQGLTIRAILETNYKNNYGFIIGPTGQDGYAELKREEIIAVAEEELNLALMDFGHIDEIFTGMVNLQIMKKDEIEGAIKAYKIFKKVSKTFPHNYEENLIRASSIIEQVGTDKLKLEASIEPSQIRMVINPVGHKIEPLKYKRATSR